VPSDSSMICLIGLGSNLEWGSLNPVDMISSSINYMTRYPISVKKISRFFRTTAFPLGSGPDFVNAAVMIRTSLTPQEILVILHDIEQQNARARETRWAARTLDLDLLSCGASVMPNCEEFDYWFQLPLDRQVKEIPDKLILPHPRLHQRLFVIGPLMDIAPHWVHPVLGLSVAELYAQLSEGTQYELNPL